MALSQEILNESELAKAKVAQSECLDDDYKKQLLNVLHLTTIATNGISQEEKIQKMTEAMHMLAVTQISLVTTVESTVQKSIEKANQRQCSQCAAMKHAQSVEEQKKHEEIIEEWKKTNGYRTAKEEIKDNATISWSEMLKVVLAKPYVYVLLAVAFFSPYSVQILEKIFAFLEK